MTAICRVLYAWHTWFKNWFKKIICKYSTLGRVSALPSLPYSLTYIAWSPIRVLERICSRINCETSNRDLRTLRSSIGTFSTGQLDLRISWDRETVRLPRGIPGIATLECCWNEVLEPWLLMFDMFSIISRHQEAESSEAVSLTFYWQFSVWRALCRGEQSTTGLDGLPNTLVRKVFTDICQYTHVFSWYHSNFCTWTTNTSKH